MKKILAYGIGAAMMLSSASVMAADVEQVEIPEAFQMQYGVAVSMPGNEMQEDITVVTNGENASASMYMCVNDGEQDIELDLPNYVLGTPDGGYLNVDSFFNLFEAAGIGDLSPVAEQFGITQQWIKLAPIDVNALTMELKPYEGALPALDETMITDATSIAMSLLKVDMAEDAVVYSIDSDSIKNGAAALDEFKANHLGFVGDILTYAQNTLADAVSVDMKPAFRSYLDAAGAGYAEANGVSEEEGAAIIDATVDAILSLGMGEIAEQIKAMPVADIWNAVSFADLAANLDGFEAKLIMGEAGTSFEITYAESTLGGTVEMTEAGILITLMDGENALGTLEIAMDDTTTDVIAKDAEGNILTQGTTTVVIDGSNVDINYAYEVPSEEMTMSCYFTMNEWEDDGSLEEPEASDDVLDVIKNVCAMVFAPSEDVE